LFVQRQRCLRQLAQLGMSVDDVKLIVMSLTPYHYVSGPDNDRDSTRGGFVYVFGCELDGIELYIKLKCEESRGCVCISFHEAEHPLTYRFCKGEQND
jgi:hypothetical protein